MRAPALQHRQLAQPAQTRARTVQVAAAKKAAAAAAAAASTAAFPGLQEAVAPLVPYAVAASVVCVGMVSLLVGARQWARAARGRGG